MAELMRHDLVWLKDDCASISPVYVVTSQNSTIPSGYISIACSLTPDKSTLSRKCFTVPISNILRHEHPICLNELMSMDKLQALPKPLLQKFENIGVTIRVYGSFSWEYLTEKKFTTPDSDLDLLFCLPESFSLSDKHDSSVILSKLHELIMLLEYVCPYKIDGEIVLPNGTFIAWREWFNKDSKVIIKTTYAISILDKSEVL